MQVTYSGDGDNTPIEVKGAGTGAKPVYVKPEIVARFDAGELLLETGYFERNPLEAIAYAMEKALHPTELTVPDVAES